MTKYFAGYDLFSAQELDIKPSSLGLAKTDIVLQIPENHYDHIAPGSSWAIKFVIVGDGVIVCDNRGNISIVFYKDSQEFYKIDIGDRIAQLILEKFYLAEVVSCRPKETRVDVPLQI